MPQDELDRLTRNRLSRSRSSRPRPSAAWLLPQRPCPAPRRLRILTAIWPNPPSLDSRPRSGPRSGTPRSPRGLLRLVRSRASQTWLWPQVPTPPSPPAPSSGYRHALDGSGRSRCTAMPQKRRGAPRLHGLRAQQPAGLEAEAGGGEDRRERRVAPNHRHQRKQASSSAPATRFLRPAHLKPRLYGCSAQKVRSCPGPYPYFLFSEGTDWRELGVLCRVFVVTALLALV